MVGNVFLVASGVCSAHCSAYVLSSIGRCSGPRIPWCDWRYSGQTVSRTSGHSLSNRPWRGRCPALGAAFRCQTGRRIDRSSNLFGDCGSNWKITGLNLLAVCRPTCRSTFCCDSRHWFCPPPHRVTINIVYGRESCGRNGWLPGHAAVEEVVLDPFSDTLLTAPPPADDHEDCCQSYQEDSTADCCANDASLRYAAGLLRLCCG